MFSVLPDDLRNLDKLVDLLDKPPQPTRDKDQQLHKVFATTPVESCPEYTKSIDAAITLIPHGWWWHISHLEAQVCPSHPLPDIPIDNAIDYYPTGRPIQYSCSLFGNRNALAVAVCKAMLLAHLALKTKAKAIENKRKYLIQTGSGPMLVDIDGSLKELPAGTWLSKTGEVVRRHSIFRIDDADLDDADE